MSDLISRQAVLDGIAEWIVSGYADSEADCSHISSLVTHLPSVENKGEWVFDETLDKHYYCSECKSMGVSYWDYCPYCGARMKGGE